ncbi:flagellar basal body L-ring protein FlgH [Sandaracinobacter sp. RS1-74]|uniref:flagellar basal body L-ring protein FlgH n=1 Tax=Sandaracinobacteroides sayramensis TaxID=2913411 RepID=UPI001EDAB8C9|nr:flagellar basal body L-ring protein FlgH [Sandaracinobacteroides sayramensis]MCG2840081.1 flagellar basal body L-ring protein FlgH [Sandaracinobacteroides sayramensis]
MSLACTHAEKLAGHVPPIAPTLAPPAPPPPATGSLWNPAVGERLALAEDRRARAVGDTLTVRLVERLQAQKSAGQDAARSSSRSLDLPDAKPFSWVPEGLFSGGADSSFSGSGSARQENRLSGEFTVFVTAVLPNGAMAISGDRRITLTRGEEQVQLTGIVRPEDIGPDNRIASTRVADARLRYTGTGEVAAQAKQGWLARFFDFVAPF